MEQLKALLLPAGIGVLLVVVVYIGGIMAEGREAARSGTGPLADFLGEFILFGLLVVLILVLFGVIRDAAP